MSQLSNTPQRHTNFRLEARKSYSLKLWFRAVDVTGNNTLVDLTGATITFHVNLPKHKGGTNVITKTATLTDPTVGICQLDLQAADLDLEELEHPYSATLLTAEGYSQVFLKGDFDIQENADPGVLNEFSGDEPDTELHVHLTHDNRVTVSMWKGLKGDQGEAGDQGPAGPQGEQGEQGIQGNVGPQGDVGDTGPQGPKGLQGDPGPTGPIGLTGPQGLKGDTGDQGPQGIQGEIGPQGETGPQGVEGPQGIKGDTGDQGPIGLTGPQGEQGPIGLTGEQGPQGIQGETGLQGPQGEVGPTGPTGDTGPMGPSGEFANEMMARKIEVEQCEAIAAAQVADARAAMMDKYLNGTEIIERWFNLDNWATAGTISVSANKLVGGANAVAIMSIPLDWSAGEIRRIRVVGRKPSSMGTNVDFSAGLDFGAADHVPGVGDAYIALGLNTLGNRAVTSAGMAGGITTEWNPTVGSSGVGTLGGTPNGILEYEFSIDIGPETVSIQMTDRPSSNTNHGQCVVVIDRNAIEASYPALDHVNIRLGAASGSNNIEFETLVVLEHLEKSRDPELAADDDTVGRWVVFTPEGGDIDIERGMYELPPNYDPLDGAPLALVAHQSVTGEFDEPWDDTELNGMQQVRTALLAEGYIVAAVADGSDENSSSSVGDRFGNDASLANYKAAIDYISKHHHVTDLYLLGASMGGITVLNLITHAEIPTPRAAGLIGGLVNFTEVWDRYLQPSNPAGLRDAVVAAYGMSDTTDVEFLAETAGHRPEDHEGWQFRGVPFKFWTSADDVVVENNALPLANTNALAAKIAQFSPEATVVAGITGAHGGTDSYREAEIASFFETYRRPAATPENVILRHLLAHETAQPYILAEDGVTDPSLYPDRTLLDEYVAP